MSTNFCVKNQKMRNDLFDKKVFSEKVIYILQIKAKQHFYVFDFVFDCFIINYFFSFYNNIKGLFTPNVKYDETTCKILKDFKNLLCKQSVPKFIQTPLFRAIEYLPNDDVHRLCKSSNRQKQRLLR